MKKHEQWSDNGSDECPYEEESYGSNNETYEEITAQEQEAAYSTIYHDGSNHSDVQGLLPVSTVYSVTDYPQVKFFESENFSKKNAKNVQRNSKNFEQKRQ